MECKKQKKLNFGLFAECNGHGTRQSWPEKIPIWALCRVPYMVVLGKDFF
jgi:hypothetical protein